MKGFTPTAESHGLSPDLFVVGIRICGANLHSVKN